MKNSADVFDDFQFEVGDLVQHRSRLPIGGFIVVQKLLGLGLGGTTYRMYLVSGPETGLRNFAEIELQASEPAKTAEKGTEPR